MSNLKVFSVWCVLLCLSSHCCGKSVKMASFKYENEDEDSNTFIPGSISDDYDPHAGQREAQTNQPQQSFRFTNTDATQLRRGFLGDMASKASSLASAAAPGLLAVAGAAAAIGGGALLAGALTKKPAPTPIPTPVPTPEPEEVEEEDPKVETEEIDLDRQRRTVLVRGTILYPCCDFCASSYVFPNKLDRERSTDRKVLPSPQVPLETFLKESAVNSTRTTVNSTSVSTPAAAPAQPGPGSPVASGPAGMLGPGLGMAAGFLGLIEEKAAVRMASKDDGPVDINDDTRPCCDICMNDIFDPKLDLATSKHRLFRPAEDPTDWTRRAKKVNPEDEYTGTKGINSVDDMVKTGFMDPTFQRCCRVCPNKVPQSTMDPRMFVDSGRCCRICRDANERGAPMSKGFCMKMETQAIPPGLWWQLCGS
eukprot:GILK01010618.1.p1 GENE.GILK01010618.1~~GILK01010618.1.p1  ORF type:complete len:423 (-),score=53.29 GILK01010618.1:162-1430(-)